MPFRPSSPPEAEMALPQLASRQRQCWLPAFRYRLVPRRALGTRSPRATL
jgi:hypothetical protein